MELKEEFGKKLAQCRKQAGKTQKQTGKQINMTQPHYARIEKGIYELNYNQIKTICKFLDVSADYLLGISEYK